VVVDARAAGLTLQTVKGSTRPVGDGSGSKSEGEAQLIAWRYTSLSSWTALEGVAGVRRQTAESAVPADADARYAWERRMIDQRNLLPLVAVPDFAAADARVRNWAPAPWGEWRLADVWLEQEVGAKALLGAGKNAPVGAKP